MEAEGEWCFQFKSRGVKIDAVPLGMKMALRIKCTASNLFNFILPSAMGDFHIVLLLCLKLDYIQKSVCLSQRLSSRMGQFISIMSFRLEAE